MKTRPLYETLQQPPTQTSTEEKSKVSRAAKCGHVGGHTQGPTRERREHVLRPSAQDADEGVYQR